MANTTHTYILAHMTPWPATPSFTVTAHQLQDLQLLQQSSRRPRYTPLGQLRNAGDATDEDDDPSNADKNAAFCDNPLDIMLTIVILVGALQDVVFGTFWLFYPEWFLKHIGGIDEPSDAMIRFTRVGGWGSLEGGTIGLLLVLLRLILAYKRRPFNGATFQFVFFVGIIGRGGALITNAVSTSGTVVGEGTASDTYVLLVRTLLSVVGFFLSVFAYADSWHWLWEERVPRITSK